MSFPSISFLWLEISFHPVVKFELDIRWLSRHQISGKNCKLLIPHHDVAPSENAQPRKYPLTNTLWLSDNLYGDIALGQHWFGYWLVAWRHQAITGANVEFSSVTFCAIHLREVAISQRLTKLLFCMRSLEIIKLPPRPWWRHQI